MRSVLKLRQQDPGKLGSDAMAHFGNNIGNKLKQAFGGNWGHPRPIIKKSTEIPDFGEVPKHKSHKKKKKNPFVLPWSICPHCKSELKKIGERSPIHFWRDVYANTCDHCGAKKSSCPNCKWDAFESKDGLVTHQGFGCGFTGKRRVTN